MEFDKTDEKLISYLYHHYREPLTKIGKACRLSRDQVEYRIRKYENEGLIRKYITIFNYDLLGYHEFVVVFLKISREKEAIKKELENMKNVISTGEVISKYDLYVNSVFKNKNEFEEIFYSFLEKHKENIEKFSVIALTDAELYPLKYFGEKNSEKNYPLVSPNKEVKISEKDMNLLRALEKNGRARIIDISKQTDISSELIVYKIKELYKNKIILGTRLLLGMEKHGFYFGVLLFKLKNLGKKSKEKIKNLCKNHPYINSLGFGIGEYNCFIQLFYRNEEEFRKSLREIKKELSSGIQDYELLLIEEENDVKTLPF
ncbi:hypothetical protein A3K73_07470 [Candidatus Pacearchaeota archaeon RBG_13_36_9]|nr:MAG: hypothetical protein A3K73_07470 [Candidatus Pacearchaeota archaeon RBG_13_36_9]